MSIQYKSASAKDLKAEWRRVSKATGSTSGHKKTKELDYLVGSLLDDESVVALSDGQVANKGCLVAITSNRLLVIRVGVLSGVDETEIGLSDILGVDVKAGFILADITIKTSNENLQIKSLSKPAARFIAQKIREGKRAQAKSAESVASVSENGIAERKQVEATVEGGWVSSLVGFAFIGILVWGIWSWVSDDGDDAVAASVTQQESDQERTSTEKVSQDTPREHESKQKVAISEEVNRGEGPDRGGPFTVEFENYLEDGSGGGNLRVNNSSSIEYSACSIELGDGRQSDRWYLRNSTVIDANGSRSYPTFIFRDRQGISPPTPDSVSSGTIRCTNPAVSQEFHIASSTGAGTAGGEVGVIASQPETNGGHLSDEEMRRKMAAWVARGQNAVKARLRDPNSVEWGELWFAWGVDGVPMVCGQVNAKNGLGGYTGMQNFISAGTPNLTFLQSDVKDFTNLWETMCGRKNNQAAVRKWGPAADIAPTRFR